jgi:transposase
MRKPRQSEPRQCKPQQRKADDLSRCLLPLIADQTLIAVVELSLSGWLVSGVVPGVERQPLKKLKPEPDRLL